MADEAARFAVEVVRSAVGDRGRVTDLSDGHEPDYRIDYADGRVAIGEVTTHVDPKVQAQWVAAAKNGHRVALAPGLGTWGVSMVPGAKVRAVHDGLPALIADLDRDGIHDLTVRATWPPGAFADRARALGISLVMRSSERGDVAWYHPESDGAFIPDDPDLIVDWLDAVVADPAYLDLTAKLHGRVADELHIFVFSGSRTEFAHDDRLRLIDQQAPTRDPVLPEWITHAWVVSQWASGRAAGLWTRGEGWSTVPLPS